MRISESVLPKPKISRITRSLDAELSKVPNQKMQDFHLPTDLYNKDHKDLEYITKTNNQ